MKSHICYERAFEHYLQTHQIPYVAVDEAKRAAFRDAKLKSFDFIVYSLCDRNWLVDIKGRRWAVRKGNGRPAWENWVTQADLDGLTQWEEVFGSSFGALLVFAYRLDAPGNPPAEVAHTYHDKQYVFAAVSVAEYTLHAKLRSPKWGTVNMPVRDFAEKVRPIAELIGT